MPIDDEPLPLDSKASNLYEFDISTRIYNNRNYLVFNLSSSTISYDIASDNITLQISAC